MENKFNELEEQAEEMSNQMAGQFYQVVQVLSSIVELQDRYHEGSHSRYVSHKAAELAKKLEMPDEEVYEIGIAGLLHDIGKVGSRESLLSKFRTEMVESEFIAYMTHARAGWEILKKYDHFEHIAELVYQHHERLDGTGSPRRISGKQILPGAAILCIVDTYHNSMFRLRKDKTGRFGSSHDMTSTANYLEQTQARYASSMNLLISKSGIWFDRKAVDVFLSMIDEERKELGFRTIVRLPTSKIETGMIIAEDYYTTYGLLIAAKGEKVNEDIIKALYRFTENDQLPPRILVIK